MLPSFIFNPEPVLILIYRCVAKVCVQKHSLLWQFLKIHILKILYSILHILVLLCAGVVSMQSMDFSFSLEFLSILYTAQCYARTWLKFQWCFRNSLTGSYSIFFFLHVQLFSIELVFLNIASVHSLGSICILEATYGPKFTESMQ